VVVSEVRKKKITVYKKKFALKGFHFKRFVKKKKEKKRKRKYSKAAHITSIVSTIAYFTNVKTLTMLTLFKMIEK